MARAGRSIRDVLLSKHIVLGRKEYKLVRQKLLDGEYIKDSLYGSYQGGSGLLVVTNQRVIIIDRRPFFDYIEDADHKSMDYLLIKSELIGATIHFRINRTFFRFRSFNTQRTKDFYSLLSSVAGDIETNTTDIQPVFKKNYSQITNRRVKPLRTRHHKHPAWSPHNPIMMSVITNSGVSLNKK